MPKPLPTAHAITDMQALRDALLAAHAAGDAQAAATLRRYHPRFADSDADHVLAASITAEDAELAIAREHGFASWRQLVVYVTHPAGLTDFLQLACVGYATTDRAANRDRAKAMLDDDPTLAERDIWHAAGAGDAEAVARFLAADPTLLNQRGGYFDWPPLLYATYSRLDLPGKSTLAVAKLLIERGADPNAYYMWGGQYRFTALTGAFGEGEMGPKNQPPHQDCEALARLLLAAGADPNDSQALYNTMFTPGSECLEMLLEHGLNASHRNNWLLEEEDEFAPHPDQTLGYQLEWAARNHHVERAKLLIDRGAEVKGRAVDGVFLYEWAWLTGHPDLAQYLADHGADVVQLDDVKQFAGICMSGDTATARSAAAADPGLAQRVQEAMPTLLPDAAGANRLDAVRTMLAVRFDPDRPSRTALHEAAFHGRETMAKLLLEHGANISARDEHFLATPLQWCGAGGQPELAAYLATQHIDIFDAVLCENTARLTALLEAQPALLETTLGTTHNFESRPEDWQTPLAYAALRDRPGALAFLLERGARSDVRDGDGRTLVEVARASASAQIVTLLEQAR